MPTTEQRREEEQSPAADHRVHPAGRADDCQEPCHARDIHSGFLIAPVDRYQTARREDDVLAVGFHGLEERPTRLGENSASAPVELWLMNRVERRTACCRSVSSSLAHTPRPRDTTDLDPGDIVLVPAWSRHHFTNPSAEDLVLLNLMNIPLLAHLGNLASGQQQEAGS
ncbi:cupin domain-containing protein [Streptomyces sp. NPDC087263]|uniref:cupin domain-containing protein n=1 Tax=Streptomyces sp. NPDC087263 TaxID=3365773 RepID=UPI0038237709